VCEVLANSVSNACYYSLKSPRVLVLLDIECVGAGKAVGDSA